MEDIDIENLNFDVYNREVYNEQGSKSDQTNSQYVDPQKKYKKPNTEHCVVSSS